MTTRQGLSLSALAKRLDRAKSGLHKLACRGQIPRLADGSFDPDQVEAALARNLDPARRRASSPVHRPATVNTLADAHRATALIRQVLRDENIEDGPIDYMAARMADTILKARARDLSLQVRRGELIERKKATEQITAAFIQFRRVVQRMPSRHASQIAAELGCDPGALDAAWLRAIAATLTELSEPVRQ